MCLYSNLWVRQPCCLHGQEPACRPSLREVHVHWDTRCPSGSSWLSQLPSWQCWAWWGQSRCALHKHRTAAPVCMAPAGIHRKESKMKHNCMARPSHALPMSFTYCSSHASEFKHGPCPKIKSQASIDPQQLKFGTRELQRGIILEYNSE